MLKTFFCIFRHLVLTFKLWGANIYKLTATSAEKLEYIDTADDRKADLEDELEKISASAKEIAKQLRESRKRAALGLTKSVKETLFENAEICSIASVFAFRRPTEDELNQKSKNADKTR